MKKALFIVFFILLGPTLIGQDSIGCMKKLDTCGCNKLQNAYTAWMLHSVYNPITGTAPVTFEAYLMITEGVTISNATDLRNKCNELFMKGVSKDQYGAPVRGYDPTTPQGWWSKSAQSNLFQEVQDNLESKNMKIPNIWSCNSECTEITPCNPVVLNPCDFKRFLFMYITNEWAKETSGTKKYEELDAKTYGDIMGYNGLLLDWTNQYKSFLDGTSTPTDPTEIARVAFLNALKDAFNAFLNSYKCPNDPVKTFDLQYYLSKILLCDGTSGVSCVNPPDCSTLGSRIKDLLAGTPSWPGYTDPAYSNNDNYAIDFDKWYYTYQNKKALGTNTTAEDDWMEAVSDALNAEFNTCYPTTIYDIKHFLIKVGLCIPLPKGPKAEPCDICYGPNTEWLSAMQEFLNKVNKKLIPDRLTDYNFYLKPTTGGSDVLFTSFYNTLLYQGGTDEDHLTWTLDEDYEGGDLIPGIRTNIQDENGFNLKVSLDWPTNETRWNFNYIKDFINIKPIKTQGCDKPTYFSIQAVYDIPDDHKDKYPSGYCPNAKSDPYQPFNNECYDTVTLICRIWESSNGLGVSKVVPCLGCNKLCNQPMGEILAEEPDPCKDELETATYNALVRYGMHINAMRNWFDSTYREKCFGAKDSFWLQYRQWQYHYTLYYYDQAGQLIKTVPPSGVDVENENLSSTQRQQLANDRILTARKHRAGNTTRAKTYHELITNYRYYSGGQLAWQHTPDGGESRFWYDELGRLAVSQNANQQEEGTYSFSRYDELGRPYQAGEMDPVSQSYNSDDIYLGFETTTGTHSSYVENGVTVTSGTVANGINYYLDVDGGANRTLRVPGVVTTLTGTTRFATLSGITLGAGSYNISFDVSLQGLTGITYNVKNSGVSIASGSVAAGTEYNTFTLAGGPNTITIEYTATYTSTTEYFQIDNISINHSTSGIQTPSPRSCGTNNWIADWTDVANKSQVVQTWYDAIPTTCTTALSTVLTAGQGENLRNRVAFTTYEFAYDGLDETYDQGTAFSYDIHGNASRIVQNIPPLTHLERNLYTMDYDYDLLSGKVNNVSYQANQPDQWKHRYEYDGDNRLVRAYTSRDGYIWENDAKYFYYLHGPQARTELGQLQVQGIDNAYTLQGWTKGMNSPNMSPSIDIGQDGMTPSGGSSSPNQFVARDAFAYYLSYYAGDYKDLNTNTFEPTKTGSDLATEYRDLYNGNIAHMGTSIPKISGTGGWAGNGTVKSRNVTADIVGNVYHYDQLNRITKHFAFDNHTAPGGAISNIYGAWGATSQTGTDKYYEDFSYDPNGNILSLNRNAGTLIGGSGSYAMDNMGYNYDIRSQGITLQQSSTTMTLNQLHTNKLYLVDDGVTSTNFAEDIDDQGTFSSTTSTINTANNYGYDKLGNLIRDDAEQISDIKWTVTGKIKSITRSTGSKKPDLSFGYDASGSRLFKVVKPKQQTGGSGGTRMSQEYWDTVWYIKDATGNAMATYKLKHKRTNSTTLKKLFYTEELYIYGSQRHGVMKPDIYYTEASFNLSKAQYVTDSLFPAQSVSVYNRLSITQTGITNYVDGTFEFWRGYKQYELANHLGNVLVTIQDRKWGVQLTTPANANLSDYYLPYVVTISDYTAFGSSSTERSQAFGNDYKYGFNNQEKDNDKFIDAYDFGARIYDGRIARWLSTEPFSQKFVSFSSYLFSINCPILYSDFDGNDIVPKTGWSGSIHESAFNILKAKSVEFMNLCNMFNGKTNNVYLNSIKYTGPDKPFKDKASPGCAVKINGLASKTFGTNLFFNLNYQHQLGGQVMTIPARTEIHPITKEPIIIPAVYYKYQGQSDLGLATALFHEMQHAYMFNIKNLSKEKQHNNMSEGQLHSNFIKYLTDLNTKNEWNLDNNDIEALSYRGLEGTTGWNNYICKQAGIDSDWKKNKKDNPEKYKEDKDKFNASAKTWSMLILDKTNVQVYTDKNGKPINNGSLDNRFQFKNVVVE